MSYKLIALDMDDTLLTTEKTISIKNQETIKQGFEARNQSCLMFR